MTKSQQPIASLVREAAKSEAAFLTTLSDMLDDDTPERLEEFFAKLNIPRSNKTDDTLTEDKALPVQENTTTVTSFKKEMQVTDGIQKFLDRHMRKLRWHVSHPSLEGIMNCVRLYRAVATVTELRIRRVIELLRSLDALTVDEWGDARELLNRAYREIREATSIVSGAWIEAVMSSVDPPQVRAALADFPDMVAQIIHNLKDLRDQVEARRLELSVRPEGYRAVRPPRYFGGDLLDTSSWKHYWGELSAMSDALRNVLGM